MLGFEPGDKEVELGFLFRPMAEGRGLAEEAARLARGAQRFSELRLCRKDVILIPLALGEPLELRGCRRLQERFHTNRRK